MPLEPIQLCARQNTNCFPTGKMSGVWNQADSPEGQNTHILPLLIIHALWHVNESKKQLCLRQFKQV